MHVCMQKVNKYMRNIEKTWVIRICDKNTHKHTLCVFFDAECHRARDAGRTSLKAVEDRNQA